jgi:hypothetical protein
MDVETQIIPLDPLENIYAVTDGKGNIAGTGTREVCEVMIYIMRKLRTVNPRPEIDPAIEPRYRPRPPRGL